MRERMREGKNPAPMVGGSSLLVIFAVLCLTVFAMLSLTQAQADRRLPETAGAPSPAIIRPTARPRRSCPSSGPGSAPTA